MDSPQADIWKEFERNVVSHSAAHHIVAIAELLQSHGYARVSDVAKLLNITRGSASLTLKALKQKGFVEEDENRFLRLSPKGEVVATTILGKKALIKRFFTDVLGVPDETAEVDTCKIEHLVGSGTMRRLARYLQFLDTREPPVVRFLEAWRDFSATVEDESEDAPAGSDVAADEEADQRASA